ncbi:MAG: AbrB/MazE/SpoVT family DNA-binding domain-containing protein [Patescibacteria group bacterium]
MNTVYLQEITTIRERGQMTIPKRIREALGIPIEGNVLVKIETTKSGFKLEKLPNSSC